MSFTNKTAHYDLPQYVADDKPTYLNDFNGAMSDIDSAIYAAQNAADQADTDAKAAQSTASGNSDSIATLTQTVTDNAATAAAASKAAQDQADANTGSINTINSLIGNGEPTTTDKTIIGAINEINGKIPESTTIDTTLSETSTNAVQNAVITKAINANTASITENETHIDNALEEIESVSGQVEATDSTGTTVKFQFGIDADGNYGYKKAGADTVTPFKSGGFNDFIGTCYSYGSSGSQAVTLTGTTFTAEEAQAGAIPEEFGHSILFVTCTNPLIAGNTITVTRVSGYTGGAAAYSYDNAGNVTSVGFTENPSDTFTATIPDDSVFILISSSGNANQTITFSTE